MFNEMDMFMTPYLNDPDGTKADLANAIHKLSLSWITLYGDFDREKNGSSSEDRDKSGDPSDPLDRVVAAYRRRPYDPELVTAYWRTKLGVDGEKAGLSFTVPDCDWTEEEIQKPMVDVRGDLVPAMMVYKPWEIRGKDGLIILGKMYPHLKSFSVDRSTPITDSHSSTGWLKVEASLIGPNRDTTQADLEILMRERGYIGQTESTYILASQASKDLTGHYLDEGSTSRLLGSHRGDSGVAGALFNADGRLDLYWGFEYGNHDPYLGARFEQK